MSELVRAMVRLMDHLMNFRGDPVVGQWIRFTTLPPTGNGWPAKCYDTRRGDHTSNKEEVDGLFNVTLPPGKYLLVRK